MKIMHKVVPSAAVIALLSHTVFAQLPNLPQRPPTQTAPLTMEQMVERGLASRFDQVVVKTDRRKQVVVDSGLDIAKESNYGFNAWSTLDAKGASARVSRVDRLGKIAPEHRAVHSWVVSQLASDARLFGKHIRYAYSQSVAVAKDGEFDMNPPEDGLLRETQIAIDRTKKLANFTHRVEGVAADTLTLHSFNGPDISIPTFRTITLKDQLVQGTGTRTALVDWYSRARIISYTINLGPVPVSVGLWARTRVKSTPTAFLGQNPGRANLYGGHESSLSAEGTAGVGVSFANAGVSGRFDIGKLAASSTYKDQLKGELGAASGQLDYTRAPLSFSLALYAELAGKRWERTIIEDLFTVGRTVSGSLRL